MNEDLNIKTMVAIRNVENIIKRNWQPTAPANQGHGRIMGAVFHNCGIPQNKLAQLLEIRPQSLTRALVDLEERGFIIRKRDEKDRRIITVSITEEGKRHHEKMHAQRKKQASKIFDCLTDEEKKQLISLLSKVSENHARCEQEKQS